MGAFLLSSHSRASRHPGQELLFNENEVPTFFTKEQCLEILKKLLDNNELLQQYNQRFTSKVRSNHEDKKSFEIISKAISSKINRKVKLLKIPYWYLRIAAKQVLLRNIKLSRFLMTIRQFNEIFKIRYDCFYLGLL